MYSAQLGTFCRRDPLGYRFSPSLYGGDFVLGGVDLQGLFETPLYEFVSVQNPAPKPIGPGLDEGTYCRCLKRRVKLDCPPSRANLRNGDAVEIDDVDGDGKPDYLYPKALPKLDYDLWCYSGVAAFVVVGEGAVIVHRCPFPDKPGSGPGQNEWGTGKGPGYEGCVSDPATLRKGCYIHHTDGDQKGKLEIQVFQCTGKDGSGRLTGCKLIRRQIVDPPTDASLIPNPDLVPRIPEIPSPSQ